MGVGLYIQVIPNPTNNIVNIYYYIPEGNSKYKLAVYNIKGQQIWKYNGFGFCGKHLKQIEIKSSGIYIAIIKQKNKRCNCKFVVIGNGFNK